MMETHLDNLCQLGFGISGLCCGVHTAKQSDLLVSQWTSDAPQCSSYLLSGHFLLLLSCTASVSSSGGLLLSHVAHPLAKHHSFTLKKVSFTQKHKTNLFTDWTAGSALQKCPHICTHMYFFCRQKGLTTLLYLGKVF